LREWAYRITDFLCDLTTQVSRGGLERYVQVGAVPRRKILYVPNGVDTERFRPDAEARSRLRREMGLGEAFVWLAVGRLEEVKDYPNLLRAFSQVIRAHSSALLLIAGQGAFRGQLERMAEGLGLSDRVRFLGVRKDIPQLMNVADGYVMSSAWEGLPMVLLEAAATALPIVATAVGGNREVVLDGESGFLVPPRTSEALAGAMIRLMGFPSEKRSEMGSRARAHVEAHYALDRVVTQWETIYAETLKRKGINLYG
jgi:glycosyltransferase involved in cell wall biosynthesis